MQKISCTDRITNGRSIRKGFGKKIIRGKYIEAAKRMNTVYSSTRRVSRINHGRHSRRE